MHNVMFWLGLYAIVIPLVLCNTLVPSNISQALRMTNKFS